MTTFIIGLILVACVLLVLVVLAQNAKGGGLAAGAAGAGQVMGAKRAVDFLEKLTWGLGIFIFVMALTANIIKPDLTNGMESPNIDNAVAAPQGGNPAVTAKDSAAAPAVPAADSTKK
jgi:preprotein translocase subunit SecG